MHINPGAEDANVGPEGYGFDDELYFHSSAAC
jgi:hypothetical protein